MPQIANIWEWIVGIAHLSALRDAEKFAFFNVVKIHPSEISAGDSAEKLQYEIQQITKKKGSILDGFFLKGITKEKGRLMNERNDRQLFSLQSGLHTARQREQLSYDTASLKADVNAHIKGLMGRKVDALFQKAILDTMLLYPICRLEIRLNLLPAKWRFVLDSLASIRQPGGCHYAPSVPISVSKPFSSSKGMV